MNVVNQGGKRERGSEATLNQGGSRSFPDTCHVGAGLTLSLISLYLALSCLHQIAR